MAAASSYIYDYICGINVPAGTVMASSDVLAISQVVTYLAANPTAKLAVQLLTASAKISINASDYVAFIRGDMAYVNGTKTWMFANDCDMAVVSIINMV